MRKKTADVSAARRAKGHATSGSFHRVGPVQIAAPQQEVVLEHLARAVAHPGCRFLEVGSWCGDSTEIFGKVAKENGGQLFCIDWWKGNAGTALEGLAAKHDVFSIFWRRMLSAGLDDCIVMVRGDSLKVYGALRDSAFDLVYIDADHRYPYVSGDIAQSAALVRLGGVLCGDDCEGRMSDFDDSFLNEGKDVDFHETVHCGVVLAVAEAFQRYSLDYSIWSVRRTSDGWEPSNLTFPGIEPRRQAPPPLLASFREYNLMRYGRHVYAVPQSLGPIDITNDVARDELCLVSGSTVADVQAKLAQG